ncbi:MAG: RIP metalloprotease RseP [Desulfurobacteriaceae bacterium]
MLTLLYFVIAIGILIFVHELGHFIAARAFDVKVETFSIGFGPKLLKFRWLDTEFTVSLIPLGGYVKMAGETPETASSKPYEFYAKPPWQRIVIALAGPVMNLLLAVVFFFFAFTIGRYVPTYELEVPKVGAVLKEDIPLKPGDVIVSVNGEPVGTWKKFSQVIALNPNKDLTLEVKRNGEIVKVKVHTKEEEKNGIGVLEVVPAVRPVVGKVIKGSPAEKAGLKEGDVILKINGREISSWKQVVETIGNSEGKPLKILVLRKDKKIEVEVVPEFNEKLGRYTIGVVAKMDMTFVKYPVSEAIKMGFVEFEKQTKLFFSFLGKLITGQASMKSLGGPIMIAEVAGKAAESGISNFVYFMGFISLQLGYFNLLPLPILDGGLILLFLLEMIRRKPLSSAFIEKFQQVGLVILGLLMIIVFYNDIMRIIR